MKNKTKIFFIVATFFLIIGLVISAYAQWDTDEEVQRVEQEQWEETEQRVDPLKPSETPAPTTDGPDIVVEPGTTKSEKTLQKWDSISTGFVSRIFLIQQDRLAGKWDNPNILPAQGFESGWKPISQEEYQQGIKSGIVDAKLKNTDYGPFYANMSRVCSAAKFKLSGIHIKAAGTGTWRILQRKSTERTEYRELSFECLARAK